MINPALSRKWVGIHLLKQTHPSRHSPRIPRICWTIIFRANTQFSRKWTCLGNSGFSQNTAMWAENEWQKMNSRSPILCWKWQWGLNTYNNKQLFWLALFFFLFLYSFNCGWMVLICLFDLWGELGPKINNCEATPPKKKKNRGGDLLLWTQH